MEKISEEIQQYNDTIYSEEQLLQAIRDYSLWIGLNENFPEEEEIILDAEIRLDLIPEI